MQNALNDKANSADIVPPVWGAIGGDLSNQRDLQNALNAKANSADIVAPVWGNITGTLSNQTDLKNALNAKANSADIVAPVWGKITGTLNNQTDLKNALNAKASASDLTTVQSTVSTLVSKVSILENKAWTKFTVTLSTSGWNKNTTYGDAFWWQDFTLTGLQTTDFINVAHNASNSESIYFQERKALQYLRGWRLPAADKVRFYCGEDGPITYQLSMTILAWHIS